MDAVTLMGGTHYATADGGVGWVLSKPSHNGVMTLTRLSLDNGEATTTVVSDNEEYTVQLPVLSADGAGHLWFTYGRQILRIDTEDGTIRRWDLPEPPPDAAPSDEDWSAAVAGGNSWDPQSSTLLFVRVSDHRLYRFDPTTDSFSTVADLPIITHSLSRVSLGGDGSVAINGALLEGTTYSRAAILLPESGQGPQLLPGLLAICIGPNGPLTLDQAGAVQAGGRLLGQVSFSPYTDVQFVCDSLGNAFTFGRVESLDGTEAEIVIYRFDSRDGVSTVNLPLDRVDGTNPHDGSPMITWGGPSVETLLPDGQGGVWLVNVDGTTDMPGVGSSPYPTLMRIRF